VLISCAGKFPNYFRTFKAQKKVVQPMMDNLF